MLTPLAILAALGIAACSDARDPISPTPQGLRPGATPSHLVRASTPNIYLLAFEVQSTTLPSTFLYDVPLVNGSTTASLSMPIGKVYNITVRGYDRYGNQTHQGYVSLTDVVTGTNPGIALSLKPIVDGAGVATVDVSIVGETRLPTGGRVVIKAPSSVEQGDDNVQLAAEVLGADGSVIPLNLGDLHWAVSDPTGGTVRPDPVQPGLAYLAANQGKTFTVSAVYHNYQLGYNIQVLANSFASISAAANYTCGLRLNGALSCWGENGQYQNLGVPDSVLKQPGGAGVPCTGDPYQMCATKPVHIAVGHFFTSVSTGQTRACAIEKGTGVPYCWGLNNNGWLDVWAQDWYVTPSPMRTAGGWQQISVGANQTCGSMADTGGYCWGDNYYGQLGSFSTMPGYGAGGTGTPQNLPIAGWTQFSAGREYTCGIATGTVYCWGEDWNLIGGGTNPATAAPFRVSATWAPGTPSNLGMSSWRTPCVIVPQGGQNAGAWCWGYNLGDPNGTNPPSGQSNVPIQMPGAGVLTQVATGLDQGCGLDGSGNALCWGSNEYGATGVMNSGSTWTLASLNANGLKFVSITSGDDHVCALTGTGGVYCWGSNSFAQFGDNAPSGVSPSPTHVWGTNQ